MKRKLFFTAMLLLMAGAFSAFSLKKKAKPITKLQYELFTPKFLNEFLVLNDSVWMYNFEITNFQYNFFLEDLQRNDPELYTRIKPDSSLWGQRSDFFLSTGQYYHWHPAYDAYPVVNIPKEGAEAFCAWMTQNYGHSWLKFRLPTEYEWMEASGVMPGHNLPWKNNMPFDEKGYYANLKYWSYPDQASNFVWDGGLVTVPPGMFRPTPGGLYDMIGNVAEMVGDKEVVKGGSWDSYLKESTVELSQPYKGPNCSVGFRIVAEF